MGNFRKWLSVLLLKVVIYSFLEPEPFLVMLEHQGHSSVLEPPRGHVSASSHLSESLQLQSLLRSFCDPHVIYVFGDSSFRQAFQKIGPHSIMELLMLSFLAEKLYSFSITSGFSPSFPQQMINTNERPGCLMGKARLQSNANRESQRRHKRCFPKQ